jgi:hypothetical protein
VTAIATTKGIAKMMIDQDLIFDTITTRLAQTAQWRRGLASKYPGDPRNQRAAARLDELSQADGREIDAKTWARLEPFFDSPALPDIINEAGREIGFKNRARNLDHVLSIIAEKAIAQTGGVQ